MSPWVWERKYEVDSLCYPIQLAYALWKVTGRTAHLTSDFRRAVSSILALWRCEQDHEASSPYRFERLTFPFDTRETLPREGKGSPVAVTGMTWSGFRPSDDACTYGYLLPANMFAVVVLGYLAEMARSVLDDLPLHDEALRLRAEIDRGIQQHGLVEHPEFGTIYAYETDGLGHHLLMDDANVPSLLALPYLGYCRPDDPIYLNTRRFVLSVCNPYFYRGTAAEGVGSPHTPSRYIWPIALLIQGLTADNNVEKDTMLDVLERTDAGTDLMHESFSADDPRAFTRPWFAWANSLFGEFLLERCGYRLSL